MRNLKKILALVLALVMSLSLMATASAKDFTDASQISDSYKTAAEVLAGLEVFRGDPDGSFRPTDSITRSEVAAVIYRIATADVNDTQQAIYTNHPFTDVVANHWATGYISYCYNAEYVKGNGDNTFSPDAKVTGYATLAMILRAMGYGKNGEFEGDGWEIRTASTAKQIGILDKITDAQLGGDATRELVAQILFRALLTETAEFDARLPYQYPTTGKTLGYEKFGLEEISGVVVANEFADLYSTQVKDEGITELETEDGIKTLAITTEITDIGESRYAYITGTKVLATGDTGLNKVTEFGHASDISSTSKFNATAEMPAASDIEYYINFGRVGTYTCDQRLEFNVVFYGPRAEASFDSYANDNISWLAANESGWTVETGTPAGVDTDGNTKYTWASVALGNNSDYVNAGTYVYPVRYTKIIRANEDITQDDLNILQGIFGVADNADNNILPQERITGDVYVGTKSTNSATDEERDISNQISFKKFFEEYINDITYDVNWSASVNGAWVKFVDNDGDGKADYAFRTDSWLDEAVDSYTTKDGVTVTQFLSGNFDDNNEPRKTNGDYQVRYMDGEAPAVGTKVICASIDNQILVEPANSETVTVTDYNWRDDQIKTTDGDTYGQSGIGNATDLQQFISTMDDGVEYTVYFDHFGYIRAYELPGGTQYALVTEIYARNNANGNLVQTWPMNVELVVKDADATEYNLVGGVNNLFSVKNTSDPWTLIDNLSSQGNYYNFLRPATAHMGVETSGFGPTYASGVVFGDDNYRFWTNNRQIVHEIDSMTDNDTFEYGSYVWNATRNDDDPTDAISNKTVSFTNVAEVNINGEDATLTGAAQLRRDKSGNILYWDSNGDGVGDTARYAVDYVQLTRDNVAAGQTVYAIDSDYVGWQGANNNNYVSATHNTEYYIIYNRNVYYFTDYVNMPALTMADNNIHAAYAVAHDTSADDANQPYWVADVIVFEVQSWDDSARTSIALAYYNPSRNDQQVQLFNALDSKNDPTMVNVIPDPWSYVWAADANRSQAFGPDYAGYGFYHLWDGEKQENGDLAVSDIEWIDGKDHRSTGGADLRWNSNLIFAGVVVDEVEVGPLGTYLNVATYANGDGSYTRSLSLLISNSDSSNVYSITTDRELGSRWDYNEADQLRYNNVNSSQIKAGDRIIWVAKGAVAANGTQSAAFVVDMGNDTTTGANANSNLRDNTATFLATAPYVPSSTSNGLWNRIMWEQRYVAPVNTPVEFNLVLGAKETAEISLSTGDSTTVKGGPSGNGPTGENVYLNVPVDPTEPDYSFTLTIKLSSSDGHAVNLAAVVVNSPWAASQTVPTKSNADGSEKTYTVLVGKGAFTPYAALAEDAFQEAEGAEVRIYTETGATALVAYANTITGIGTGDKELVYAEAAALEQILTDLIAELPEDTLKTNATTANTTISGFVDGVTTELETALTGKKEAAVAAVDAMAEGYTGVEAVSNAVTALKYAINTCTINGEGDSDIATYWNATASALVVDQDLVKALAEAIQDAQDAVDEANKPLNDAKTAALAAVDTMIGNKTSEAITTAKKNLVGAINACTTLEADGNTASSKVLATYWDATAEPPALVAEQALVDALQDALDAYDEGIELNTAKLDAIEAVDKLITDAGLEVPEYDADKTSAETLQGKYSALVKKIKDCTTLDGGSDDAVKLNTYWTAADGLKSSTEKDALDTAIADAKKVTVTVSAVDGATVKTTSDVVAGSGEDAGKYSVTVAEAGASTDLTFNIADEKFEKDTEVGSETENQFVATVTFTVTGGTATKSTVAGETLSGTDGSYTLTIVKAAAPDAGTGTDVTVSINAPAAE